MAAFDIIPDSLSNNWLHSSINGIIENLILLIFESEQLCAIGIDSSGINISIIDDGNFRAWRGTATWINCRIHGNFFLPLLAAILGCCVKWEGNFGSFELSSPIFCNIVHSWVVSSMGEGKIISKVREAQSGKCYATKTFSIANAAKSFRVSPDEGRGSRKVIYLINGCSSNVGEERKSCRPRSGKKLC